MPYHSHSQGYKEAISVIIISVILAISYYQYSLSKTRNIRDAVWYRRLVSDFPSDNQQKVLELKQMCSITAIIYKGQHQIAPGMG